jgi:predicted DNA-binding transcriptional regulator YafY
MKHTLQHTHEDNGDKARLTYAVLIRLIKLHQILFEQQKKDNGVRPWITTEKIAAELQTSERTICSDLARLRDDFGMPAFYVEKRKGVGYTEKVTSLPTQIYTRGESMALCVAMLGMSIHKGTPFAAAARSITKKLTAGLRKELAVEFEALEKAVSFHCIGADAFIPTVNFEVVTPAIIYHQELEIDYAKSYGDPERDGRRDAESGVRRVEPLHLACIDFGWYLFAYDPMREGVRTFALRRMRSVRMTGVTCKRRAFNAKKELGACFGPFHGRKAEDIRLRFWGRAAGIIPEFLWHQSQAIEPVPGEPGVVDLTMKVSSNPRLIGWISE